jgi:predicted small lipoprotein YifL
MKNILFALVAFALLSVAGCGDYAARSLPPATVATTAGVGSTLTAIGVWLLWIGSSAITLGAIGIAGSFFLSLLLALRDVFIDAIVCGLAVILVGSSINYIGHHPWLLAVAIGLVGAILIVRNLPAVEGFLGITPKPLVIATPVPTVTSPLADMVAAAAAAKAKL